MRHEFTTHGTCSRRIDFDLEDGLVKNVRFQGGCPGNTLGVAALAEGRSPEELISILKGIKCGPKPTSCPDQLAKALEAALAEEARA